MVAAGVGVGGAVVGGAAVGAAVVGAGVVGATVAIRMLMLGDADSDGATPSDGDGEVFAGASTGRPKNSAPITSSVSRLPATPARARSIQRGPRRGGGMILVVSPATVGRTASGVLDESLRAPLQTQFARRAHVAEER